MAMHGMELGRTVLLISGHDHFQTVQTPKFYYNGCVHLSVHVTCMYTCTYWLYRYRCSTCSTTVIESQSIIIVIFSYAVLKMQF